MRFVRVRILVLFIISLLILGGALCIFQHSISVSTADDCDGGLLLSEPNNKANSETRDNARAWTNWSLTTDMDFSNGTLNELTIDGVGTGGQLILKQDGQWINMKPTTKPSVRHRHGMATVFGDDKIVLFGGTDGFQAGESNETWQYDFSDNQWNLKNTPTNPSKRYGQSMSAINNSDESILFGGEVGKSSSVIYHRDTWKYNATTNVWTNMTLSINGTPNMEWGHAMAMVYNTDKVVLFGGFYTFGSLGGDETWVYDLSENKWEQKLPTVKPPVRSLSAMAPIYNTDLILLFAGHNGQTNSRRDTWIYNLTSNTWTQKFPSLRPDRMCGHTMAPIYGDDKVLLFGSEENTWVYDYSENSWTPKYTSIHPSKVGEMANLFGTAKLVHFGGYKAVCTDETWSYDINMFESTGDFTSIPYDCSGNSKFKNIDWSATTPPGTKIEIQLKTGKNQEELDYKSFMGPGGSVETYYSTPGAVIWSGHDDDRWCQYKAYFNTTDLFATPVLHDTLISYNVIPELSNSNVNPPKGDITKTFNFTIIYSDHDNDPPGYMKLEIEGTNHTMIENNDIERDYIEGKIYWYKLKLPYGDHLYRFFASDGDAPVFTYPLPLKVDLGPLDHIIVTPAEVTITADDYIQFTAVGYDLEENIIEFTPKWDVNGGGTIDSGGNFTAKTVGTWKVYASSAGISGNASINVTNGSLKKIIVTPEVSRITTDEYKIFTAQGFDADNNVLNITFTWEVTGGGVIDQYGNYTAGLPGIWTIFANRSGISGNAIIEVSLGELAKIIINPEYETITTDELIEYTATCYDADMNILQISPIWDSSGLSTITKEGNFTSRNIGEFQVFANFSDISGNATVMVVPGAVKTITVSPLFEEINVSETAKFTAKFYDEFNNEVQVTSPTWEVSGGGTIDQTGKFIGEKSGYWTVYCNVSDISETAQVRVNSTKIDDGKDDDVDVEPDDDSGSNNYLLIVGFGVIILVVIIILILFLVLKKKPHEQEVQTLEHTPEQPSDTQVTDGEPGAELVTEQKTCPNCNNPMYHNPEANYFECSMCNSVLLDDNKDNIAEHEE
jgi:hypothetical protein